MPGRGRRVAARQSQLGQRKRRQNKNVTPSSTENNTVSSNGSNGIVDDTSVEQATATVGSRSATPEKTTRSYPRTSGRAVNTELAHNYVKSELVKIVVMGSVVILALVGLSFLI